MVGIKEIFKYNCLNSQSDDFQKEFRIEELDIWFSDFESFGGLLDDPLGGNPLLLLVRLGLELVVLLDAVEEGLPAGGEAEVLNADVNPLGHDSVPDLLVYDDSDGPGVDVEDSASSAVVELVGHALVDGAVHDDVDDVSDFIGGEGPGDVDGPILSESLSEFISSSSSVSVAVSHGWSLILINIINSNLKIE